MVRDDLFSERLKNSPNIKKLICKITPVAVFLTICDVEKFGVLLPQRVLYVGSHSSHCDHSCIVC